MGCDVEPGLGRSAGGARTLKRESTGRPPRASRPERPLHALAGLVCRLGDPPGPVEARGKKWGKRGEDRAAARGPWRPPSSSIRDHLTRVLKNFERRAPCRGARRTSGRGGSAHDGRVDGILSICGPEVSRGSLLAGSRRVQAPTPHARAHPSVDTYQYRSSASCRAGAQVPKISIQSSLGSTKRRRMRRRRLPDPRPIREGVREPICPRKKCAIWT